jgi:two-component system, LytTR family, response regulator
MSRDRDDSMSTNIWAEPALDFRSHDGERWQPLGELISPVASRDSLPLVLVGERAHRLYVLKPENVDYVEADGNYVRLHTGNIEYISRDAVARLETLLAGSGFVRIERSLLINVRAIAYAQRSGRGTYAFTMNSGACLRSGAKYRSHILRVLPLGQRPATRHSAAG